MTNERSCGNSAWSSPMEPLCPPRLFSGSRPVYVVNVPRLRPLSVNPAVRARSNRASDSGASYDNDSSRTLEKLADLMNASRSVPEFWATATSVGSLSAGKTLYLHAAFS